MAARLLRLAVVAAMPALVRAAELPVPCIAGSCGSASGFVTGGAATATINGNTLSVNQSSDSAFLNWQSFNISADGTVNFIQPDSGSIAVNRIYQNDPARIFGALNANGRVYLLNQNGFLFGSSSRINVGALVASSLDLSPAALSNGIASASLQNEPAFQAYANGLPSGAIDIAAGAQLITAEGGQVLVFAPTISNQGTIATPGGQAILAAGQSIFLTSSTDSNLRGLLVEVGGVGGTVTNGSDANAGVTDPAQLAGQIIAERGNVTLAGLAVNQLGRVSATTSVRANGSIYLQARDHGTVSSSADTAEVLPGLGGELRLGANSRTEVALDTSGETTLDANEQPVSTITMDANRIELQANARVVAPHGNVSLTARRDSSTNPSSYQSGSSSSRILIDPGASIDVSGANIQRSMESLVVTAELRGTELADSHVQRDGALRGETVYVDSRLYGTRSDGTSWVGSPIGELSGWINTVTRDVGERSLTGGRIDLMSEGDLVVASGATLNVSGGSISYASGYLNTSTLLGADGKLYDIGSADRDRVYAGLTQSSSLTLTDPRWGVTETYAIYNPLGRYEQGYVEGKDAGVINLLGQQMVIDGQLQANTVAGRLQRKLPGTVDATAIYRPYDQFPLAGSLTIGQTGGVAGPNGYTDSVLGDISFRAAGSAPLLPAGFAMSDALPASLLGTTWLDVGALASSGIGQLTLRANGTISLAENLALNLPAGGSFDVRAATVDIAGDIRIPGGSISLTAAPTALALPLEGGVNVGSGAVLDVRGLWVNDTALLNGGAGGNAPLVIDGGRVTINGIENSVQVAPGSLIDASGGGQMRANGQLQAGKGGNLSFGLTSGPTTSDALTLNLDGTLRSFAFADGGRLSISAEAICIADTGSTCTEDSRNALLRVTPAMLASGGFSSYSLGSSNGGVEVAPGTSVVLQQQNWLTSDRLVSLATGGDIGSVTTPGLLDAAYRRPVSLSLSLGVAGQPYTQSTFDLLPSLSIGTGASIRTDAGGQLNLSAPTRLLVNGTLEAPAGAINLVLSAGLPLSGDAGADIYFEDQGIWLGSQARLLASGTTRLVTDSQGRISGSVLDGGDITLTATRGHVMASSGSIIDVSGTAAPVDIRADARGGYQRNTIGSDGGTLSVTAAESIVLGSTLRAAGGLAGSNRGGTLSIVLDAGNRLDPGQNRAIDPVSLLPDGARVVELWQSLPQYVFSGSTLPSEFANRALVSADQVSSAGFDSLALRAGSLDVASGTAINWRPGQILFRGDVNLAVGNAMALDAAVIASDGGNAVLSASSLAIGNRSELFQRQAPATLGSGTIALNGTATDVIGALSFSGAGDVTLGASSDLRLIGVQVGDVGTEVVTINGRLYTPGNLTLRAGQIYPDTLTRFTVDAGSANNGTLSIERPASAVSAEALSAGGSLLLRAPSIVQAGTLRAPFGALEFDADSLTLTEGSVTSTSGYGLEVLFGNTQGSFDWTYGLSNAAGGWTWVYGTDGRTVPAQRLLLNANDVMIADGAVLDVRGGGDMIATEFVPGTTGTRDILSSAVSPGSFAVLPGHTLAAPRYDLLGTTSSSLTVGNTVHLAGVGDLPEGDYVILPASYAALPGAYLVTPVTGYQDIVAGEQYTQLNGSTVVSGYYANSGTSLRDARTSGFALYTNDAVAQRAQYTLTSANDFFALQAELAGLSASRLPRDAGTVSIVAGNSLTLEGDLLAAAAAGGRGAALDIASDAVTIVGSGGAVSGGSGGLVVSAADISAFGADSVLIGGVRTESAGGVTIDTRSSSVSMVQGAQLTAPEILLAATQTVAVGDGASLTATSDSSLAVRDLTLSGDGALLRVSGGDVVDVTRTGGTTGDLQVATGAQLVAQGGSINLESAGTASVEGTLLASGGALNVTGGLISVLGSTPVATTGIQLSGDALAGIDLETLILHSRSALDLYDGATLTGRDVRVEAAAIRGQGGQASIAASGELVLAGVADAAGPVAASTQIGTLQLSAGNLRVESGSVAVSGFSQAAVSSAGELRAGSDAALSFDGALQLSAQRLTAASGADLQLTAAGSMQVSSPASGAALTTRDDLGGGIVLTGASIDLDSDVLLPSGKLELYSTAASGGGVTIGPNAQIDLAGRQTLYDGTPEDSAGGSLTSSTRSGDVVMAAGSRIDVAGGGQAAAGRIALAAVSGSIDAASTLTGQGGRFAADGQQIANLSALNAMLEAGGFNGERTLRLRGAGDLTLAAGEAINASEINLTADQGSVIIDGSLRASGVDGGRVLLAARDDIVINGSLDARAASASERNGRVDLQVEQGGLQTGSAALIATVAAAATEGSAGDGQLRIRLPQSQLLALTDADIGNDRVSLGGDWSQAGQVSVEGFRVYTEADGSLSTADVSTSSVYYTDAAAFAAQAGAIAAALALPASADAEVLPGVEIRSNGNLVLANNWDLSDWRFNGLPGVLTLRATGNLDFNASLSDGFTGLTGANAFLLNRTDDSWSYRLVAGADLTAADTLAVQSIDTVGAGVGNLTVAAGNTSSTDNYRMIRTGTGSIDVRAARNVQLGNSASTIYTAGTALSGTVFNSTGELGGRLYPANGGDISVVAGGDVVGAVSNQLVNDWLWRVGTTAGTTQTRSTAWTVNFSRFLQNVGALGGGDVRVSAGGNVNTLSVSTPTIGRQTGGTSPSTSVLDIIGGGNVLVSAGGDVLGGSYYSGRGRIDVQADGSVGRSTLNNLGLVLALGDTQANVRAREDIRLEAAVTPTWLPHGTSQNALNAGTRSLFSTYTDDSSLSLQSLAGDLDLVTDVSRLASTWSSMNFGSAEDRRTTLRIYPPTLKAAALRGSIDVDNSFTLYPAAQGSLSLLAYDDLRFGRDVQAIVSDVDPAYLAGVDNPRTGYVSDFIDIMTRPYSQSQNFNATVPVRQASAQAGDLPYSRLVAETGDVTMSGDSPHTLYFGAPVTVYAGRDVVDLSLWAQNLSAGDVTSITAGRDIEYSITRNSRGSILVSNAELVLDGPGQLALTAGRDINLQNSRGVTTQGNLNNPALPDDGASISALVGLNGQLPDYDAFAQVYLRDGSSYNDQLIAYITTVTGTAPASKAEALQAFSGLKPAQRAAFLQRVFFAELRASGRHAANPDPASIDDYSAGYRAIQTLFPGGNPDLAANQANPYAGNIALYFSRMYTLDGGDVSLLAPGGSVNAGLATPPSSFGVAKSPSELGIVAQRSGSINVYSYGDLQVNESRVFAADGGNILVWSTQGDIDAGRGAKTAVSAPPPTITVDSQGRVVVLFPAALTGSGIQTLATSAGVKPGDVDLYAPHGVVNAGDAGIVAGNLTIGATAVLGADNIKVSGVTVGVPVDTGGLGASLSSVSSQASSASSSVSSALGEAGNQQNQQAPLAQAALSWLEVFVLGLGEENCKPDDVECLKRQQN